MAYGEKYDKSGDIKKRHHIYLFSLEDLDNPDIISMVETTPTYSRKGEVLRSIKDKAKNGDELSGDASQNNSAKVITF